MHFKSICLLAVVSTACSRTEVPNADATPWRKPGDTIDSILTMPEYLRRFRAGVESATALAGGATTREALATTYLVALSQRDTVALGRMLISRAEFAWLIFPDHRYATPPYELDPAILWGQLTNTNAKGLRRALQRYGGASLALQALDCTRDTLQLVRGTTRLWGPCTVRYRAADSTVTHQLFGAMVERDGHLKFLSYANDF